MKQLTCEMCGGTDLIKQDGVFLCQNCGMKYSVEEAKKMMIDGTVDVQGTVKVDTSDKVKNLYVMARRAKDENNAELASKYYEMISFENPSDWESIFYLNYFKASQTNLQDMTYSVNLLSNSLSSVFEAIYKSDKTLVEKWNIVEEVIYRINMLCESCVFAAKSHYRKFSQLNGSVSKLDNRTYAVAELQKNMAELLEKYFPENSKQEVAHYLKSYVLNYLLLDTVDKGLVNITLKYHSIDLIKAENKIKLLDPNYIPLINNKYASQNGSADLQINEHIKTYSIIGAVIGGIIGVLCYMIVFISSSTSVSSASNDPASIVSLFGIVFLGAIIGYGIGKDIKKQ